MSVPVGRRKQSRFEAQHQFYRLRDEVTRLTMNQFGFSYEKYNQQIEKYREAHKTAANVDEVVARWKAKAEILQAPDGERRNVLSSDRTGVQVMDGNIRENHVEETGGTYEIIV